MTGPLPPTVKMGRCLEAIRRLTEVGKGVPPSISELARDLGYAGRAGLHHLLREMQGRGLIAWEPGRARTLRIVGRPTDAQVLQLLEDAELALMQATNRYQSVGTQTQTPRRSWRASRRSVASWWADDAPDNTRGGSATMAHVDPDSDEVNFFPTPPWAARAGAELVKQLDPRRARCGSRPAGRAHGPRPAPTSSRSCTPATSTSTTATRSGTSSAN
jgi:hypothetical protein